MPSSNKVRKVTSENYPTDAGREGELIFRLVYEQTGCKKPVSRLWLSSMEENAIREGFAHLKPSTEYDALYNAALCRERADWMVGINASRLFSCLYGQPLAVGRVMTPVLAMTVVREAAIAAFVPEKFYTVALTLADGGTASSKRFAQKADQIVLRGELSYPVPLGDDPRGNIVRLDNAIGNFADRIADADAALDSLEQQKQAAEVEIAKPFAQEEELQTKSARLAELDALLNMEHQSSRTEPEAEEKPDARPSVLAALEEKADKVEPVRPFKSYLDKDGDAR